MKKFKFSIQGNTYQVELLNIEENVAEIEVNGSTYKVEIMQEVKTPKTPKLVRKVVEPSHEADVAKTHKPSQIKAGAIKSPLPGTILQVKTQVGKEVKVGETLMILEAMKMENNINADRDGVIESVKVKEGDAVLEGDVLIEMSVK